MKKLPKAILLDADGTLYDSEKLNYELNRLMAKELYDFDFTWELYDEHIRRGTKKSNEVVEEHGVDVDYITWHSQKLAKYKEIIRTELKPTPGLLDFLAWAKTKKIVCVVVSAAGRQYIESSLLAIRINDYFEIIVSGHETGEKNKPHPYPYEYGLKMAGVKADQAIAVEDTDKGIASAQAAGLFCVAIRNDSNNDKELAKANLIIDHYSELKDYLLR